VYLRSLTLKGFKSFPDRTRLEFTPGVSVMVGPNGSGKSNITDAVLWALGEQSPLAVRGRTMQDVIFAGGRGQSSRPAAEVEVVIDNSNGELSIPLTEIAVTRRLERSGEGEYRLNGARCRLVDVLDMLSDTGLGKEMHSVVSQGRVDAIVHSRPRDRRMLIEEAAGLGKHRKRRHRAQLKLIRTEANLTRARDVEREARGRLRPLKRQAEAADLHERLERQTLELQLEVAAEHARAAGVELGASATAAAAARSERDAADRLLGEVSVRRERAEAAFRDHARAREELAGELWAARSAGERITMRLERARDVTRAAREGERRRAAELEGLAATVADLPEPAPARVPALQAELAALDRDLAGELERELALLDSERAAAEAERARLALECERCREELREAEDRADAARAARREAERAVERARGEAAERGAELAALNAFLRRTEHSPGFGPALAERLRVSRGFELAVAAALGDRLRAALAAGLAEAEGVLGGAEGSVLLHAPAERAARSEADAVAQPLPLAERLLDRVVPEPEVAGVVERLLADAWVVPSFDGLPPGFRGLAVTVAGRVFDGDARELRQVAAGGEERRLEAVNRREAAIAASEAAVAGEATALAAAAEAASIVVQRDEAREGAERELRAARRREEEAAEVVGAVEARRERRRQAPLDALDGRRARLEAELRAEQRLEEQARRERAAREERRRRLEARVEYDAHVGAAGEQAVTALCAAREGVEVRRRRLQERLDAGREVTDMTAATVRQCAGEEADIQRRLREAGLAVTQAEVRLQRAHDVARDAGQRLAGLGERLGLDALPAAEPMGEGHRTEIEARMERLVRRRDALGPVNPLAKEEYDEAVARVDELEAQREDLEAALRELESLIADTDRDIRTAFDDTFAATAHAFEEVIGHLFPGGRGRLVLTRSEPLVSVDAGDAASEPAAAEDASEGATDGLAGEPGVEIEITLAGKSMKRLSLLSGGEKSLVALGFMFAVFLARPCPFYILDEVEAALDDRNIDRFLELVRRYSDRAQFIIVTHQKRTMDAADCLYGVSMAGDGVSRVVSRRLRQGAELTGLAGSEAA
jgi:chromosome segregation protein